MTGKGGKQEPPLHLDLDFSEALERFARVKPDEVRESIERAKKKNPPGDEPPADRRRQTATQPSRRKKRSAD